MRQFFFFLGIVLVVLPLECESLYQPMRISERHYELGELIDFAASNPMYTAQNPRKFERLHGGVYHIVDPQILAAPLVPHRIGDRNPEDNDYFKLDTAEYPNLLEQLKNEMNATTVKLYIRGYTANGAFQLADPTDVTNFCQKAESLGLHVILGYWWDTSLVSNTLALINILTDLRVMVDLYKREQSIIAWGIGEVKAPTPDHANHDAVMAFLREMSAVIAIREHDTNTVTPAHCYPRRPVQFTMGTVEVWGQLRYQPFVALVPEVYMDFTPANNPTPDSPEIPAIAENCIWEEWSAAITLGHSIYTKYTVTSLPDYVQGVSTRQRMRHQSWGEPVMTHSHTCTIDNSGAYRKYCA